MISPDVSVRFACNLNDETLSLRKTDCKLVYTLYSALFSGLAIVSAAILPGSQWNLNDNSV